MTLSYGSADGPLAGLRVLEIPGPETWMLGKTLADLGAEVVLAEPPEGDPGRAFAPHAPGGASLAWTAFNLGKQSVVVDLAEPDGRARLYGLIQGADLLIEGAESLAVVGLDAAAIRTANAGILHVGITPFGPDGPRSHWQGADLVHFAAGGYLNMTGAPDGPPLKPSAPLQSYLLAGMHGLVATLLGLRQRRLSGSGQHVEQVIRDCIPWMLTHTYQHWDMLQVDLKRQGARRDVGSAVRLRNVYAVRDGYAVWMFQTGHLGARGLVQLVAWMHEHGLAPEWLRELDWEHLDLLRAGPDMPRALEEVFGAFFATRSKQEILEFALRSGVMIAPMASVADLAGDRQLANRDAWRTIAQPGIGDLRVPGPPLHASAMRWEPRGPAPAIGEGAPAWDTRPTPSPSSAPPPLPLSGIRVLDFGSTLAAPTAGRHFADFGADVIKIESSTHPDTLRVGTPYASSEPGLDRSGYFGAYNAGKRSLAIDMNQPGAKDVIRRLVERADVVLENFVPGVMQRWGLTWDVLREWNPRLVFASHALQGQDGPYSRHRGYGQIASAMTGWYDLTGEEGGEPLGPYSAYTDFLTWPILAAAILLGLEERDRTGAGQRIDHAQVESSIHFLAPLLLDQQLNGRIATRATDREPYCAPSNVYRAAGDDRWVAIATPNDWHWECLAAAIGRPELAADERFATFAARKANEPAVDALLAEYCATRDPDLLALELQAAGVPAAKVARASDLFADPQLQHRGYFVRLPHAVLGDHAVITPSFRIDGLDAAPRHAAPLLGEHTYEILTGLLGIDDATVAAMVESGLLR